MKAIIYKLESRSGKYYIGSSKKSLKSRVATHFSYLKKGKHPNFILQKAWNKYGVLTPSIIEEFSYTSKTEIIVKEQYWIDKLKPSYNLLKTAYRQDMTPTMRKKISDTLTGRKHSPERVTAIRTAVRAARLLGKGGGKSPYLVLNTINGVYYDSIKAAADASNINSTTLWFWLRNKFTNKSNFKLV